MLNGKVHFIHYTCKMYSFDLYVLETLYSDNYI